MTTSYSEGLNSVVLITGIPNTSVFLNFGSSSIKTTSFSICLPNKRKVSLKLLNTSRPKPPAPIIHNFLFLNSVILYSLILHKKTWANSHCSLQRFDQEPETQSKKERPLIVGVSTFTSLCF